MSENIHAGHRSRLKAQFREHGLEGFTDIEALELLLFYAIPRADTNALAHALLKLELLDFGEDRIGEQFSLFLYG